MICVSELFLLVKLLWKELLYNKSQKSKQLQRRQNKPTFKDDISKQRRRL